jgi:hypothetical protein
MRTVLRALVSVVAVGAAMAVFAAPATAASGGGCAPYEGGIGIKVRTASCIGANWDTVGVDSYTDFHKYGAVGGWEWCTIKFTVKNVRTGQTAAYQEKDCLWAANWTQPGERYITGPYFRNSGDNAYWMQYSITGKRSGSLVAAASTWSPILYMP